MGNKSFDHESGQRVAVSGQKSRHAPVQIGAADHGCQAGVVPAGGWLAVLQPKDLYFGQPGPFKPLGNDDVHLLE